MRFVSEQRATSEADTAMFEDFYRDAHDEIYRTLAVVLRDPQLASEAVDEAMTRAFQRWSAVGQYGNPRGWVYQVAFNWARSRLRSRRPEVLHEPGEQPWTDHLPDPELDRAVARLPLAHREVVVFRFLFDMTQEQIAAELGVPIGTVKSRLHRALEALRKELEG